MPWISTRGLGCCASKRQALFVSSVPIRRHHANLPVEQNSPTRNESSQYHYPCSLSPNFTIPLFLPQQNIKQTPAIRTTAAKNTKDTNPKTPLELRLGKKIPDSVKKKQSTCRHHPCPFFLVV